MKILPKAHLAKMFSKLAFNYFFPSSNKTEVEDIANFCNQISF